MLPLAIHASVAVAPPAVCRRSRTLSRRAQGGSSLVELALILPLFMLLMIGIIEMSIVFFTTLTMQYAVREGARYAVTGQSNADPNTANPQRYLAVIQKIKDSSMGFYDSVSPVIVVNNITYATASSYNANMFGSPGQIIVLQLNCTWPLNTPLLAQFFSGGKYSFTVAATMLNESY